MFSDWADGSFDWETFHTKVVIPWVDRKFRTIRCARAAVGASMGSLGALDYAARHPGLFKAVLSVSGSVDTNLMVGNAMPPEVATALGLYPPDLKRVWGNPALHQRNWQAHNPTALARKLRGVHVLVTSGTGYAGNGANSVHSGSTEQVIWTGHRTFLAALTAAGVPYTARVTQGGVHNWPWFDAPMRWGLPKLIAYARS